MKQSRKKKPTRYRDTLTGRLVKKTTWKRSKSQGGTRYKREYVKKKVKDLVLESPDISFNPAEFAEPIVPFSQTYFVHYHMNEQKDKNGHTKRNSVDSEVIFTSDKPLTDEEQKDIARKILSSEIVNGENGITFEKFTIIRKDGKEKIIKQFHEWPDYDFFVWHDDNSYVTKSGTK